MTVPVGHKRIVTYLDGELAEGFERLSRQTDGSVSAALRRLIALVMNGQKPLPPRGVGQGKQVGVRLKKAERQALKVAAEARGVTPASWVRSLVLVHLARQPQWNSAELDVLRDLSRQLGAIGNNINQMAYAINLAVHTGDYAPRQGVAAREAAEIIRFELRRVAAVVTGNFDYWGLPEAEKPTAMPGAVEYADALARIAEADRRSRPRRRPRRFAETQT